MRKRIAVVAVVLTLASSAWACRIWTSQTWVNGKLITCSCMDCGQGPHCNCY